MALLTRTVREVGAHVGPPTQNNVRYVLPALKQTDELPVTVQETPGITEDRERAALIISHGYLEVEEIAAQILQPDQAFVVVSKVDRVENTGIELRTRVQLCVLRSATEEAPGELFKCMRTSLGQGAHSARSTLTTQTR